MKKFIWILLFLLSGCAVGELTSHSVLIIPPHEQKINVTATAVWDDTSYFFFDVNTLDLLLQSSNGQKDSDVTKKMTQILTARIVGGRLVVNKSVIIPISDQSIIVNADAKWVRYFYFLICVDKLNLQIKSIRQISSDFLK
jgi:hypothetical protein